MEVYALRVQLPKFLLGAAYTVAHISTMRDLCRGTKLHIRLLPMESHQQSIKLNSIDYSQEE